MEYQISISLGRSYYLNTPHTRFLYRATRNGCGNILFHIPGMTGGPTELHMTDPQVLLVDDSPIQAEARQAILSRAGNNVLVARSAVSALSMLEDPELCSSLGILVTDHLMPGMAGPELVRHVRQMLPELPILVLSGLPDAEAEYAQGQVVFRMKPFPPVELIRLVKHMLGARARRTA